MLEDLSIKNNSMISAIYYALLQSGYNFYSVERDAKVVNKLQSFILSGNCEYAFFSEVKQNSCEVYPYWPRAAMLETATFFIDLSQARFINFDNYKNIIFSAKNISDTERNQAFWICLGELREDSIIHEFIHHIVHPAIENRKDEILHCCLKRLDVDSSYFLDGSDYGKLNAFEEYMVRQLTAKIMSGDIPKNVNIFFDCEMRHLTE